MFLTERQLRNTFWENYNYSGRAVRWQFESPLREGSTDLITIEQFQGNYQINTFEFKLSDIKKVLLQAEANIPFSNKSWIVIPSEKENIIKDRYLMQLKKLKYVGVITVQEGGRWEVIHKPYFKKNLIMPPEFLNVLMCIV